MTISGNPSRPTVTVAADDAIAFQATNGYMVGVDGRQWALVEVTCDQLFDVYVGVSADAGLSDQAAGTQLYALDGSKVAKTAQAADTRVGFVLPLGGVVGSLVVWVFNNSTDTAGVVNATVTVS